MAGRLVLVATPLGNLSDLSPRAREALCEAETWIVEDTRVSGRLQSALEVKKKMIVVNDHTSPAKVQSLCAEIEESEATYALITDAGTPGISDPGSELVDQCSQLEVEIDSIPGPSAPILALSLSGFYAQRFAFLGFLPRKPGEIKSLFEPYRDSTFTLAFFESPHRFLKVLPILHECLGARRFVIARELTKLHQQIYRGNLSELPDERDVPAKGEFTIVIEGYRRKA